MQSIIILNALILATLGKKILADNVTIKVSSMTAEVSNGLFTAKLSAGFVTSLTIDGKELIGNARGFYCSINGATNFSPKSIKTVTETAEMVDLAYISDWGELHYVVMSDVNGMYSYFVATGIGTVGEFRTLYRVNGSIFRNGYNVDRSGAFPTLSDIKSGEKLQDETWKLANGTVYTKYNWASYVTDDWVHGVYGGGHGVWLITASHEYINGGPLKQELMVHVESATGDGVVLNMLSASHYGNPEVAIPSGKVYGPWLVYFNDGSSSDAESRAKTEKSAWPYSWLLNSNYTLTRATVTGNIQLSDGRAAAGAMVVLAKPGGDIYAQGSSYIYWNKADSNGSFSIPDVCADTYTLYAYADGGDIGDITDQFEKDKMTVSGTSTNVGSLTWSPPKYTHILWQIGTADRKVTEFNLGNIARAYGVNSKVPSNLAYIIGSSKPSSDWYYAQTSTGTWTIDFTLNATFTGTAHLTIAQAGQTRTANVGVTVNGKSVGSVPTHTNDASIYRSGISSGHYHFSALTFPATDLKSGANTVKFIASKVDDGGGIMYDTIKLEID